MDQKPNPNLNAPVKKSPEQEYISAVASLAGSIQALADNMETIRSEIEGLTDQVSILSDYCIRKGKQDGTFKPDEYPDEPEEKDGPGQGD